MILSAASVIFLSLRHHLDAGGIGAVFLEAWNFGKAVVGCEIPAVSKMISSRIDGCLSEQKSSSMAEAVTRLLLDPKRARAMGRAGTLKAQEKYTWRRVAERADEAYKTGLGL